MAEITVRDATPDDAAAIVDVRTRTWQHAYAHIFPQEQLDAMSDDAWATRWTAWWRSVTEDPAQNSHTLVAEDAGRVVGFAHLGAERSEDDTDVGVGELFAIYVLPSAWGSGIGQALMKQTLVRFRSDSFTEAILWVLEDNPRTRRFYERAGWHEDATAKDEEWLGTTVREIRYRISLNPAP